MSAGCGCAACERGLLPPTIRMAEEYAQLAAPGVAMTLVPPSALMCRPDLTLRRIQLGQVTGPIGADAQYAITGARTGKLYSRGLLCISWALVSDAVPTIVTVGNQITQIPVVSSLTSPQAAGFASTPVAVVTGATGPASTTTVPVVSTRSYLPIELDVDIDLQDVMVPDQAAMPIGQNVPNGTGALGIIVTLVGLGAGANLQRISALWAATCQQR